MYFDYLVELLRAFPFLISRRGVLAGAVSGLSTIPLTMRTADEAEAKRRGRHKQRRKKKNHQQKPSPPVPPSPPPGPAPVTRPDATCSGDNIVPLDAIGQRLAQTFTAITSGSLDRAELSIFKSIGSTGDFILQLAPVDAFGVPTNEILAFTTVTNASLPSSGVITVQFNFANPATVVAGTQYALVLTRQGPGLTWVALQDDPCGGQPFSSPDQTAPFAATPFGSSVDCIFTTFVTS